MLSSAAVCEIQYPAAVIYQTQIFHLMDTKSGMTESKSEAYWSGVNARAAPGSPASLNITLVYVPHYKTRG